MAQATRLYVSSSFYYLCLLTAFAAAFWCLSEYVDNSDITEISYQKFDSKKGESQYPSLTLCLLDRYKESILRNYHDKEINGTTYSNFLKGKYWNDKMIQVDYASVTIDINDYIIGTCMTNSRWSECLKLNHIIPSTQILGTGPSKCFSFVHKSDAPLKEVYIAVNNSIFSSGVRPMHARFLAMFHYPDQIIRSLGTMRHQWQSRKNASDNYYVMSFSLKDVELLKRRRNGEETCYNWEQYDSKMQENTIKSVGCQPPYWKSNQNYPNCSSRKQLANIILQHKLFNLEDNRFQTYVPPCIEIKKMELTFVETSDKKSKIKYHDNIYHQFEENAGTAQGWFIIKTTFWRLTTFKEMKQIKAYSLQSFIGNAGGYIGLLVGVTISELPNFVSKLWLLLKRLPESGKNSKNAISN